MTDKIAKKYLVTGGAGFIGSFICEALVENGQDVVCIDNLSTGKVENINHLLKQTNFKFIKADVTVKQDLGNLSETSSTILSCIC